MKVNLLVAFFMLANISYAKKPTGATAPTQEKWVQHAIARSEQQLLLAANEFSNIEKNPRSYENGKMKMVDFNDWTCGFFPGSLWYIYELTGNEQAKKQAEKFMSFVEPAKNRTNTHDLGFILNCSFGNAYRLTRNEKYKEVLQTGANSLMTRYNPDFGIIKSWESGEKWNYPVIIDNMMNLEFLFEVANYNKANKSMRKAAISHADLTLQNHFRPDYSCFHVVDYDTITGKVVRKITHQGFSDASAWARGQAWALYGYTLMYRETKNKKYLKQAENVAGFILNHPRLPEDKIPFWDFDYPAIPNAPRDASAAAIIASALIEMDGYVKNKPQYFTAAEFMLKQLSSDKYLALLAENGHFVLKHSTGNKPGGSEIDAPLSYADYYYLEALKRYIQHKKQ